MKVEYDYDNCPLCPDCNVTLDCDNSNGRDTETMGGHNINYYRCENCHSKYELITTGYDGDNLYPCS
jgi:hypothetical protein